MSETVLEEYGFKASMMAPGQMQAAERMAAECATLRARVADLEAQLATARAEERERLPLAHLARWLKDYHALALNGAITLGSDEGYQIEQTIGVLTKLATAPTQEPPHA